MESPMRQGKFIAQVAQLQIKGKRHWSTAVIKSIFTFLKSRIISGKLDCVSDN